MQQNQTILEKAYDEAISQLTEESKTLWVSISQDIKQKIEEILLSNSESVSKIKLLKWLDCDEKVKAISIFILNKMNFIILKGSMPSVNPREIHIRLIESLFRSISYGFKEKGDKSSLEFTEDKENNRIIFSYKWRKITVKFWKKIWMSWEYEPDIFSLYNEKWEFIISLELSLPKQNGNNRELCWLIEYLVKPYLSNSVSPRYRKRKVEWEWEWEWEYEVHLTLNDNQRIEINALWGIIEKDWWFILVADSLDNWPQTLNIKNVPLVDFNDYVTSEESESPKAETVVECINSIKLFSQWYKLQWIILYNPKTQKFVFYYKKFPNTFWI